MTLQDSRVTGERVKWTFGLKRADTINLLMVVPRNTKRRERLSTIEIFYKLTRFALKSW